MSTLTSIRPSVSSLSTVTDTTRRTVSRTISEASSAITTPHGEGPGFFSNKVYKPSAARQYDFKDTIRSKSGGDLARSRLRSSDRSQRHSMTDLVIEPLIEHVHDEDISEEMYSGSLRDPNKSPRSADVSSYRDTSSSADNTTVVTIPHNKLTKTTSAVTAITSGKFVFLSKYNFTVLL